MARRPKSFSTEERNPRTRGIDLRPTRDILRAMSREDAGVARAVARAIPRIAEAVDAIGGALLRSGRLIYAGAGTSGRLAALDAAECPPTFGVPRGMVVALIAGGRRALTEAVEGAEDNAAAGARDVRRVRASKRDVVVGLSASGRTPYVLGALEAARRAGARTVAVVCNRGTAAARAADIAVVAETGPEAIAGSTRLKAGTAQKLILNMLSTGAMIRLGRVYDNWMIGVAQTNRKLRARALGILQQASGARPTPARKALAAARGDLRIALVMLKRGVTRLQAEFALAAAGGDLRRALRERR
ncbi:MAG TPA: N-acetylmuramic acid 6-phosphate etherase [Patescibacteria group bacterium]|nr:N-acetylmuramic acid 6-phosphate etherase [Patescibacteria group bacterium]